MYQKLLLKVLAYYLLQVYCMVDCNESTTTISTPPDMCTVCKNTVGDVLNRRKIQNYTDDQMEQVFIQVCYGLKLDSLVCGGIKKDIYLPILYIIDNMDKTSDEVCAVFFQNINCGSRREPTWSINISKSAPLPRKKGKPCAEPITALQLTDVHYDPKYKLGSNANCGRALCCQDDSGKPKNSSDGAGYWTDYRTCDIPMVTIENTLKYIKTNIPFDYFYFTGDVVAHDYWNISTERSNKDREVFYKKLNNYFPNKRVFPILGNHEAHPVNFFAPESVASTNFSTQWLFDSVWMQWKRWLPATAKATVLKGGYYTVLVKTGFRIIALNNNIAFTLNCWILFEDSDTYDQLQWLANTLDKAEKNREVVHILMHLPNGDPDSYSPWCKQFARIIERYANTITGIFNGHTHYAEINLFYKENNPQSAISASYSGGSLTPYSDVNPNFRIYAFDAVNLEVLDYDEYIFNLTAANMDVSHLPWYKLYSFKSEYGVESMSPRSLAVLAERISKNVNLREKYFRNKVRYGDAALNKGCDTNCQKESLCHYVSSYFDDKRLCTQLSKNF